MQLFAGLLFLCAFCLFCGKNDSSDESSTTKLGEASDLKAAAVTGSAHRLTVTWTAATDTKVSDYLLVWNTSEVTNCKSPANSVSFSTKDTLSKNFAGLEAATSYYFAVCTKDSAGNLSDGISAKGATNALGGATLCASGTLDTTCTISSTQLLATNSYISGKGSLIVTGSTIGMTTVTDDLIIDMNGDVTISSNSTITANVEIRGTNLTIAGNINASGLGSAAAAGTAPGQKPSYSGYGGGGANHFGKGGRGGANHICLSDAGVYPLATTYGDPQAPVTVGSGGGPGCGKGGAGGGKIKFDASGNISMTGTVKANGENGTDGAGVCLGGGNGGGAGGSIWLVAVGTITGAGNFQSKGGNGGGGRPTAPWGGGGGGGSGGYITFKSSSVSGPTCVLTGGVGGGFLTTDTNGYCKGLPGSDGKATGGC